MRSYILYFVSFSIIILALYILVNFGDAEGMVTLGTNLLTTVDIPGATYGQDGNQGVGIDVPAGYTKINTGSEAAPIFKMKPIIPDGYKISDTDPTKLVTYKDTTETAVQSYKSTTDALLNQGPYLDIPNVDYATSTGEDTPLPTKDSFGNEKKYYRIRLNNPVKYVMKEQPDPLPLGYELGKNSPSDKTGDFLVFNTTLYALSTFNSQYDAGNLDVVYRDTDTTNASDNNLGVYYQYDQNGNMIKIENTEAQFSPVLYYIPGAYKFGSSNYVPNYEDSVYLSRTTRQSQVAPIYNTTSMLGGFCTQNKNDVALIEEKCGALDLDTCASTSCCTLLGGQKCVAGNENGPRNTANYTDYSLKNKDFYYYQGKCYGNCKS
jgi:hypothetical protein